NKAITTFTHSVLSSPLNSEIDGISPTFKKKPWIAELDREFRRIHFECVLLCEPRPSVTWYYNGVLIKPNARHKTELESIQKHLYRSLLVIEEVVVEDAGKYKVIAKNDL
ncbi:hypothetical protein BLA29_013476, partial [Euroglyphus maynei]